MSNGKDINDLNEKKIENILIRKAIVEDVNGIIKIASSVGKEEKSHMKGFLMDDYTKDIHKHKNKMLENILKLEHIYVAEDLEILGFLIAYTKEQWLKDNEDWVDEIYWHPDFDKRKLDDFILIDKTAIHSQLTGRGIGSKLYEHLFKYVRNNGINNIFSETLIAPTPNFASLKFRLKQNYKQCGFRYEKYSHKTLATLVYHKEI